MKARNLLLVVISCVTIQQAYGSTELSLERLHLGTVSKSECSHFSEEELHSITSQLDVLFRGPISPTPEWNHKVSVLLGRLPYSRYNRMYNAVMSTTYKKAINQKFQGYQAEMAQKNEANK